MCGCASGPTSLIHSTPVSSRQQRREQCRLRKTAITNRARVPSLAGSIRREVAAAAGRRIRL